MRSGVSQGPWIPTCGECGVEPATYLGICRACAYDYRCMSVLRGDLPTWNDDNECTLCGEHSADGHHVECYLVTHGEGI